MIHSGSEVSFKIDLGCLYLQEFSIEHVDSIYKISNQPEIANFLPDWKSTKEQRVDWVTNYEIPANKAFLEAAKSTGDIEGHFLKLGVFISATDEFIGWCCTGIKEELPAPNREIMYAIVKSGFHSSMTRKSSYLTRMYAQDVRSDFLMTGRWSRRLAHQAKPLKLTAIHVILVTEE